MTDQPLHQQAQGTGVAVIGMAGRFPGASSLEEYWHNLVNGIESIERSTDGIRPVHAGPSLDTIIHASSRLKDIELFDAGFFGFSPREAELIDPQHRLFLECVHEALERAGYDPERYGGLIGVYAGMGANTYYRQVAEALGQTDGALGLQLVIGNDKDYLTTLVSYKLNLRGPSVTVQTACSTSLVAVHLACQSLLDFECDVALAGGVSVRAPQPSSYRYYEGGILSPDGYCRAFDARAQGTVFGNGLGVVVLRRLEDALADGDRIWATIRGSAVNNDGAGKVGYTAPSVSGQVEMVRTALARAGVDPRSINYLEAHGTGTPLGDPIEITALTEAYRAQTAAIGYCGLGSVKSNIGHLDAAAGVAGLIKTVLALANRTMPPTLHFREPNPKAAISTSPFFVVKETTRWDGQYPRRAAVSSLGIGGTNAHVVLEEAPVAEVEPPVRSHQVLVLSARSADALDTATANLAAFLQTNSTLALADVAYTLQVGRRAFSHRLIVSCADLADGVAALESAGSRAVTGVFDGQAPSVAFMFPGGGAHHVNMAAGLYRTEPRFRKHVDDCLTLLRPLLGFDLGEILHPSADRRDEASRRLRQTSIALPALFVTEYALAKLWMDWGVRPQAMVGHSLGEYVAACLAGVLSLPDALSLVVRRSQLMDLLAPGSMISVALSEEELCPLLGGDLSLAAVNAPSLSVVSGSVASIAEITRTLSEKQIDVRPVHIAVGAHSPLVEPILDTFRSFVASLPLRPPEIPFISNVTGTWITAEEATRAEYWATHLRNTVRFSDGVGKLLAEPSRLLLEVGPGRTLSTLAAQHPLGSGDRIIASLPHPYDTGPDERVMLEALGRLWIAGLEIDWPAHQMPDRPRRVELPTYPFERKRFWIGRPGSRSEATVERRRTSNDWLYVPSWRQSMPASALPRREIAEHRGWLIFSDAAGLGDCIAQRLRAKGAQVVCVRAGEGFAREGNEEFTLNPSRREDYDLLFGALDRNRLPHTFVHLWNVTSPVCETPEAHRRLDDTSAFEELLFLAQASRAHGVTDLHLALCAVGLAHVLSNDVVHAEKALAVGACRVMPQEYIGVTTRWIDLAEGSATGNTIAELLLEELHCESPIQAIAYRGTNRWVQGYENVSLRTDTASRLKAAGVYVITGGLGGLGLILARHLAATFGAKLVLGGRTRLPEPTVWTEWLESHPEADPTSAAIRAISEIEASGGAVVAISADVSDPAGVELLLRSAQERFGKIDGVFHLAGVPGAGLMDLKTASMASSVFAPKVRGTCAVIEACRGRGLDFLALFSSTVGVTGGIGSSDYCAASCFMDAVAVACSGRDDPPIVAIDWDAWQADRWQDAALAELPEVREQSRQWRSQFGIRAQEGMDVLSRVLGSKLSRVLVSTQDLKIAMDAPDRALSNAVTGDPTTNTCNRQRPSGLVYVGPRTTTETIVASVWEAVLGVSPIGIHDNFFKMGGHSLRVLMVVARLRQELGTEVPVRALFEQPTVAALAALIDRRANTPVLLDLASDDRELRRVLEEVERMTTEEVRTEMAALTAGKPSDSQA